MTPGFSLRVFSRASLCEASSVCADTAAEVQQVGVRVKIQHQHQHHGCRQTSTFVDNRTTDLKLPVLTFWFNLTCESIIERRSSPLGGEICNVCHPYLTIGATFLLETTKNAFTGTQRGNQASIEAPP